jgi:hypothetical protein
MYHVTNIDNLLSILRNGIIPSCNKNGLMTNHDKKTYITNSLKYIKIMAEGIAHWDVYVILKVEIDISDCKLIWWKGKGYKEWATDKIISPSNITVFKIFNRMKTNKV